MHLLPNDHVRTYRLCTLLHKSPSELENEPASELDWLLAIDAELKGIEKRQNERAVR